MKSKKTTLSEAISFWPQNSKRKLNCQKSLDFGAFLSYLNAKWPLAHHHKITGINKQHSIIIHNSNSLNFPNKKTQTRCDGWYMLIPGSETIRCSLVGGSVSLWGWALDAWTCPVCSWIPLDKHVEPSAPLAGQTKSILNKDSKLRKGKVQCIVWVFRVLQEVKWSWIQGY